METKESIKSRMYKSALNYFGVKSLDILDPLIKLMIEALASEIYKLSIDLNNIEYRLLERIAQLLTPDILMAPQPAHIILQAHPLEKTADILMSDSFFYEDRKTDKLLSRKINFHPVANFQLVNANIGAIISEKGYYEIDSYQDRELILPINRSNILLTNTIWIGINIDTSIKKLSNLSFYFDFPQSDNPNEIISLLPFSTWTHCEKKLGTTKGIYIENKEDNDNEGYNSFFSKYDLTNITNKSVKKLYDPHFITILDTIENNSENYKKYPDEFNDVFRVSDEVDIKPLLWFKIETPPNLTENILNDIFITLNAFPCVNRQLESITTKSNITDIVPLKTKEREFFFSVKSVSDSHNRPYNILPYKDVENHVSGTYSIRRGGIERMDNRDAKEYISDLIDLLRDESVSFSLIGKDYLIESVKNINMQIFTMEQKLREIKVEKDINSYLIIDNDDQAENIYIEYWITNCEFANIIKSGSSFYSNTNTSVNTASIISLSSCQGGKSIPKSKNTLDIYKYILTTRDQIFTSEDIINHCHSEFGEYFSELNLEKGIDISNNPKEGLIRTIDVNILVNQKLINNPQKLSEIKTSLLHSLREKSPDTFNYRVFIK